MSIHPTTSLLTEEEVSKLIGVDRRTIQAWRYRKKGPRFVRFSCRCVRYRIKDINSFVSSHLVEAGHF